MSTEREKALEEALAQIDRIFGKTSDKKVATKVAKSDSDDIVIDWSISQVSNQPWEGQVTIGYKWDKHYDHVAINVKDLSKIIAQLKLQQRVARYEAAIKNLKDFPPVLSVKK